MLGSKRTPFREKNRRHRKSWRYLSFAFQPHKCNLFHLDSPQKELRNAAASPENPVASAGNRVSFRTLAPPKKTNRAAARARARSRLPGTPAQLGTGSRPPEPARKRQALLPGCLNTKMARPKLRKIGAPWLKCALGHVLEHQKSKAQKKWSCHSNVCVMAFCCKLMVLDIHRFMRFYSAAYINLCGHLGRTQSQRASGAHVNLRWARELSPTDSLPVGV